MSIENTFLFLWIKTHSKCYNILESDKIDSAFIHMIQEEEFIHNFHKNHFKNSSGDILLDISKNLDYFSFDKTAVYSLLNSTCKIKIWKIFFFLSFLEEFSFNRYIKINENLSLSNLSINDITLKKQNVPDKFCFRKLLKNPLYIKPIFSIIYEVLSEVNVNFNDYQFNKYFCDNNESILDEPYVFEEESNDSYYECNSHEIFPQEHHDESEQHEEPDYSTDCINYFVKLESKRASTMSLLYKCDTCTHTNTKIEDLLNRIQILENTISNLREQLDVKDETIQNANKYNNMINNEKNSRDDLIRDYEKKLFIMNKREENLEEKVSTIREKYEKRIQFINTREKEFEEETQLIKDRYENVIHQLKVNYEDKLQSTEIKLKQTMDKLEEKKHHTTDDNKQVMINNYNIISPKETDDQKLKNYKTLILELRKIVNNKNKHQKELTETNIQLTEKKQKHKNKLKSCKKQIKIYKYICSSVIMTSSILLMSFMKLFN
jgi:hypothetical protein